MLDVNRIGGPLLKIKKGEGGKEDGHGGMWEMYKELNAGFLAYMGSGYLSIGPWH